MQNGSTPFFSVIIPLYKKERCVERALRGVLAQQEEDFGGIVGDDGSTGPTAGMVGPSCREVCEGRDVGFLDEAAPGTLRRINYFDKAVHDIGSIDASSVAINRAVFDALGGFAEYRYGEYLEYWARVALEYPVAKSDCQSIVYYRGTGGAMENMVKSALLKASLPASLSDISPSVSMLSALLAELPRQSEIRRSVVGYINSRLVQGIRTSFIRGDMPWVKAIRALCIRPLVGLEQRRWWLLAGLPPGAMALISGIRAAGKTIYLKFGR